MKARVFALSLVAVLCALPLLAAYPNITAGDDVWDTPGGGGTNTVITSADWFALCGVNVPDTSVTFKGFNIPGQGTGDTVITRLGDANLPSDGSSATVRIQLKALSFVSASSNPCSSQGLTLKVSEYGPQASGTMTITRTSSAGGTFSASVPVSVVIRAVNSSGATVGSTYLNGVLNDSGSSPWSYQPPNGGAPQPGPWYPSVDPVTHNPQSTCRFGNETAPSTHCYQPAPKCGGVGTAQAATAAGTGTAEATDTGDTSIGSDTQVNAIAIEKCTLQAQPVSDTTRN